MKRIIKASRGYFYLEGEDAPKREKGTLKREKSSLLVGDFVETENDFITKIYPRKSELIRPRVANIDQVLITFPVDGEYIALTKHLILAELANSPKIILLINKIDLGEFPYTLPYETHFLSTYTKEGLAEVKELLKNKVSVLAGLSGAGKTSILNALEITREERVGELSRKINKGRHTTRQISFYPLGDEYGGGYLVDTPGFLAADITVKPRELGLYFPELDGVQCFFSDCSHRGEKGCNANLPKERYGAYLKIYAELEERERRNGY